MLEQEEAVDQLERERSYWRDVLAQLQRIQAEPTGQGRKARTFRIALEGGIHTIAARLEWLDSAIEEVRSAGWSSLAVD